MMARARIGAALALVAGAGSASTHARQAVWRMNDPHRIGGFTTTVSGHPVAVAGPFGKALRFDGVGDSILVEGRPLVGVRSFTIEAVIRPEPGEAEQRFLHIAETDPTTGLDSGPVGSEDPNHRIMFELRVAPDGFYVDGFINSTAGWKPLAVPSKRHALGRWHVLAQTYDGAIYRTFVDGVLQGEVATGFAPHGPGRVRIGARMNGVSPFHGAIGLLRFTDRALRSDELLRLPR